MAGLLSFPSSRLSLQGVDKSGSLILQSDFDGLGDATVVSATSVTASGRTCAVTVVAKSAQSKTDTDSGAFEARHFPLSCVETVRKSLQNGSFLQRIASFISTAKCCSKESI